MSIITFNDSPAEDDDTYPPAYRELVEPSQPPPRPCAPGHSSVASTSASGAASPPT